MQSQPNATRDNSDDTGTAKARLISIGSSAPHEYQLDKQTVNIGSNRSNDVVVNDTTVSRRHATITHLPGGFELADLASTNGTFVNGRRMRVPTLLRRGDEIKFGSARYTFVAGAAPTAVAESSVARFPAKLRRMLTMLAAMFIAGFVGVRYRSEIGTASSAIVARFLARPSAPAPSAANTESASAAPPAAAESPVARASAAPSPVVPVGPEPGWLKRVNYYRTIAKLPPDVEDPTLTQAHPPHPLSPAK